VVRLSEILLSLLCPLSSPEQCECNDPQPYRAGCAYGGCEILKCRACGRVISFFKGHCYYPYSPP